jgi:hypothetical protein
MRTKAVAVAVVATVFVVVVRALLIAGTARHAGQSSLAGVPQVPAAAAARASAAPGVDPRIQRWFLLIHQPRVAFDNVLFKAEQDIKAGAVAGNCSSLLAATTVIKNHFADLSAIPNGGPAIVTAYLPPITEFAAAATACQRGDFSTARAILGDTSRGAIADYGEAQDKVDEILDAGA